MPEWPQIDGANITPGTITNTQISASAGIAPSKIAGTAVITSDGRLSDARTPVPHSHPVVPGGTGTTITLP